MEPASRIVGDGDGRADRDLATAGARATDLPTVETSGQRPLRPWVRRLESLLGEGRWFLLSAIVGVIAGLGAIAFHWMAHRLGESALGSLAGYHPVRPRGETGDLTTPYAYDRATISPLWCLLLPTVGGLAVGWLIRRFAPDAKGHGTDSAIHAYHHKKGVIHASVVWVKTVASSITLGTGGSGGGEGPIAQIGAGFGSVLASWLGLPNRDRRILLAVGMGAGVAAIFRAPLAGALFAAEILYHDCEFESEVVMPALVGCITSYSVFTWHAGPGTLFAADLIPNSSAFTFHSPIELVPYAILALVLSAVGHVYVRTFHGIESAFERLRLHPIVKPALGGLLTGGLALGLMKVLGDGRALSVLSFGYAPLQESLDLTPATFRGAGAWALCGTFALLALGKIVATGLTIGSGGSAGVFGPSMVIGGSVGTAVGILFQQVWPGVAPHPGAFTIVGMAAFFTGVARVPISTLIMVSEMTGNYDLLVPAMGAGAITFALCRNARLYRSQVSSRTESPAHRGDFIVDVLEGLRVSDLMDRVRPSETVTIATPLRALIRRLAEGQSHYYPVVDGSGALAGIFSTSDVRRFVNDETMWDALVAADVMTTPVIAVTPADDLSLVMRRFTQKNIDEIPVVDVATGKSLLGLLRRREVIEAYNRQVAARTTVPKPATSD